MAGNLDDSDDGITDINVTPLVDVMLVLLIIFMATTTYIAQRSINVALPQASSGATVKLPKSLSFTIDKDSKLYLDERELPFADIHRHVKEAKTSQNASELQAVIKADTNTPHGTVIKLIDEVRKHGINDFAIRVESKPN